MLSAIIWCLYLNHLTKHTQTDTLNQINVQGDKYIAKVKSSVGSMKSTKLMLKQPNGSNF